MAIVEPWKVLERSLSVDHAPWVRVYHDRVELPDGRVRDGFHRIVLPDFAVVVALTPAGDLVMVREYKHGIGRVVLGTPAGGLAPGEDPLEAARRELREETGYAAAEWQALGCFVVDGTTGCGTAHLFLARDAMPAGERALDDTEEIDVELVPAARVLEMVRGEIAVLPVACALALAALAGLGGPRPSP